MAAVAFALIFQLRLLDIRLGLIFVTVLMTQLSISALNDWADRQRDAAANRQRPVAIGRISSRVALSLSVIFAVLSIAGSLVVGPAATLILLVGLAAGWTYDLFLKPTPLSFIPFAVAFPLLIVWVSLAAQRPMHAIGLLFIGGIPLAIAIHFADAIPDRLTDARAGLRTVSVVLAYPFAEILTGTLLLVGIAIMYIALWRAGRIGWPLLSPLSLTGIYWILALGRSFRYPTLAQQLAKWTVVADAVLVGLVLTLLAAYG